MHLDTFLSLAVRGDPDGLYPGTWDSLPTYVKTSEQEVPEKI